MAAVLAVVATVAGLAVLAARPARADAPVSHPVVFRTAADVERARANIKRYDWARKIAEETIKQADEWLARSDDWIRSNMPGKGACFAYGFTGCPICGGTWGWWDKADCSFDRPGTVKCSGGHILPDTEHPDPGTGYKAPDGRIHYFVGAYNSWAIEQITLRGAESLAFAYSYTGDERYAAKAAFILDLVADIYPSCDKGSWDYPSDPPSGRLDRPWYQVARVLVRLVDAYDQIFHTRSLDVASATAGLTRRANIEQNILKNGAAYCYEQSLKGGLHNGEADYIRGSLAVGVCLGMPEYVKWALDGPFGIITMLENNIDRDGLYYETSSMYSGHARALYLTFADPLRNYRGSGYPDGVDLYSHPRFRRNLFFSDLALNLAGHISTYGDSAPDSKTRLVPEPYYGLQDYIALERLFVRSTEKQDEYDRALGWMAGASGKPPVELGDKRFMLFSFDGEHTEKPSLPEAAASRIASSVLFGQKGVAVLRSGRGNSAQGLMLRFGPALTHSHRDDLNLNYVARGADVSYDIGYVLGSTHTQVGWAHQTASHNLVVVDEKPQLFGGGSGGSLHLFAAEPGMSVVEASSEASYSAQKVKLYRRTLALIGEGDDAYAIDIFRVRGGSQHDYIYHSRSDKADVAGIELGPPQKGSLAGPDIDWHAAQLNDGDMKGHPNRPYWNPTPGNGYGFLASPRFGKAAGPFTADWRIDSSVGVRLAACPEEGDEIIAASAPGLYPNYPKSQYVLWRRKGDNLTSAFAAAIDPYGSSPKVLSVRKLPVEGPSGEFEAVCLEVKLADGSTDYVYSAPDTRQRTTSGMTWAARFAVVRASRGAVDQAYMVQGRHLEAFGCKLTSESPAFTGRVADIKPGASEFVTAAAPSWKDLSGRTIIFSGTGYSRTTAYTIKDAVRSPGSTTISLPAPTTLGRGIISAVTGDLLASDVPHEYARSRVVGGDTGFFRGKTFVTASGASATARRVWLDVGLRARLTDASRMKPGDAFTIVDLKPGDSFLVPGSVVLQRSGAGYKLSGTPATARVQGVDLETED